MLGGSGGSISLKWGSLPLCYLEHGDSRRHQSELQPHLDVPVGLWACIKFARGGLPGGGMGWALFSLLEGLS